MLWLVVWSVVLLGAALGLLVIINGVRFSRRVAREASSLLARVAPAASPVGLEGRDDLPAPVRRYLEKAVARTQPVQTVRLRHGGSFRPVPDRGWMPIRGEQYYLADAPGFVWWGRVRVAPGLWVDALDKSVDGEGRMTIRFASTLTVGDLTGARLDEAALGRLLGEMVFFPTVLLDRRFVSWEGIDDKSAKATVKHAGREVSVVFEFGDDGMPARVHADRYRAVGDQLILTPWSGYCRGFREVEGVRVPQEIEAVWHLDTGDLPYARFVVEQIEFDRRQPF